MSLAKTPFLSGSLQRHGQGGADALLLHGMIAAVFLIFFHWLLDFLLSLSDASGILAEIQAGYGQPFPEDVSTRIHYGSMACDPQVIKD